MDDPVQRASLEIALEHRPANSEGWYSLGLTYRNDDTERAEALFRRAIEVDPTHAAAHRELGFVLWRAGKLELAESSLSTALKIAPADAWARCYLGAILKQLRRLPEAIAEYKQAIGQKAE